MMRYSISAYELNDMSDGTPAYVSAEKASLLTGDETHQECDSENHDRKWNQESSAPVIVARAATNCLNKEERRIQRLNSDLLSSIESGDFEFFQKCLRKGANVNAKCRSSKFTACHAAVFFDKCNLLRELLKKGADCSPSLPTGCEPLHIAALKGCLTCLKTLIQHQPNIVSTSVVCPENTDDSNISLSVLDSWDHRHELQNSEVPFIAEGSTALHIACRQLHTECVEYLLHQNADTEALDCHGRAALDMVVKTVETINHCSMRHEKAKVNGSLTVHSSMEMVDEFDPNKTLVGTSQFDKISDFVIFLLVDHAASRNIFEPAVKDKVDWRSTYLLHPAVIMENEKLLKFLLNRNVDLEICNSAGDTPLHLAVRGGSRSMLETFIEMGKVEQTLEMKDSEGKTPLLIAAATSWNYGANVLLEVGANVTSITDAGDNVLHLAARTNNRSMIRELFTFPEIRQIMNYKNVNSETPLMVAVLEGNMECVHELLVVGVDHLLCGENSRTIAHIAAEKGHEEILELILRCDSRLLSKMTKFNETPLHVAIAGGHIGCVRLLLRKGSPTRIKTQRGDKKFLGSSSSLVQNIAFSGTALHYGVMYDRLDIVECLINHDSGLVHIANDAAWTPLHTAVHLNHPQCAEYIIKHGGNLSREIPYFNNDPRSVFDVLCYSFHDPVLFLEQIWDSCIVANNKYQDCTVSLNYSILRPISSQTNQMTVLYALVKCGNEDLKRNLLTHPLTQTFLNLKWTKIGKFFSGFMLLIHTMFAFSVTSFAVAANDSNAKRTFKMISIVAMLVTVILLVANMFLAMKLRWSPIKGEKTWLRLSTYMIALMVGLCGAYSIYSPESEFLLWKHFLPVPVLLSWLNIIFLLRPIPSCGVYIHGFLRVLCNTIQVIFPFVALYFGFVIIYIKLFTESTHLSSFISDLYTNIIASISRFDHQFWISSCGDPTCDVVCNLVALSVMTVFTITLLVMLISLSVHDVTSLIAHGQSRILAEQITLLYQAETYLCDRTLLSWIPKKLRKWIEENRKISASVIISLENTTDPSFKKYFPALRSQILKRRSQLDIQRRKSELMT